MKKVTFSITVVVLLAMIVGLIGYDRFSTSQNAKKYQSEEKTTTTTKEETTKTKTKIPTQVSRKSRITRQPRASRSD